MSNLFKKALFVGCSFVANSGFTIENRPKYHWPHLLCQQTGHIIVNRAIGGMSNYEIFLRTVEAVSTDSYDLVVVMWSNSDRHWAYCSDNNIDDFTILTNGIPGGFNKDADFVKTYAKLHCAYFNNKYVGVKNWLLHCLTLEKFLKSYNTKYIFVKGFNNYISHFNDAIYHEGEGFFNINPLKYLLDFDQRPDDYILTKIKTIQNLIESQDQTHWSNLLGKPFNEMAVDLADDKQHPGPNANLTMATDIINLYKKLYD